MRRPVLLALDKRFPRREQYANIRPGPPIPGVRAQGDSGDSGCVERRPWTKCEGSRMKVVGLFAGIGGLESGLATAGHEAVVLCEIWEPARGVLSANYPDVPCEFDIADLKNLPADAEMVVGG